MADPAVPSVGAVAMPLPGPEGRQGGMGYFKTAYFLVATMVGAGFLALPRALAQTGWVGVPLLLLFVLSIGFTATRLGRSWMLLEERWPRYLAPARQPYMDLAEMALGPTWRKVCLGCIMFTLIGYGISFFLLIGSMMNSLVPSLSLCHWCVVSAAIVWLPSFFGTPKDFWQASVLAVAATLVTIVVILVQLVRDIPQHPAPQHPNPSVLQFALGFSGLLFALGGASVFPTLQNDMSNRNDWWKSVVLGFSFLCVLYLPVAVMGYVIIGDGVSANVLLDLTPGPLVTTAMALDIVNILITFVVIINPVAQAFEDILDVPHRMGWRRIVIRSSIVLFELVIALAIPDFGAILNLIGGSTIAILSFLFPPIMYMKLMDMVPPEKALWKQRTMPLWERTYLWLIIIVASVGSVTATATALGNIIAPGAVGESCFVNFLLPEG